MCIRDSLSTAFNGNGENCRHIEVAVGNTVTAYAVAFIGKLNMQEMCIRDSTIAEVTIAQ